MRPPAVCVSAHGCAGHMGVRKMLKASYLSDPSQSESGQKSGEERGGMQTRQYSGILSVLAQQHEYRCTCDFPSRGRCLHLTPDEKVGNKRDGLDSGAICQSGRRLGLLACPAAHPVTVIQPNLAACMYLAKLMSSSWPAPAFFSACWYRSSSEPSGLSLSSSSSWARYSMLSSES